MALSGNIPHKIKLKQQNKKHNKFGHKSKRQIQQSNKGRVSSNLISDSKCEKKELSRQQRRNQAKQIRVHKREEVICAKRQLGTETSPPFMVSVILLSFNIDGDKFLHSLTNLDQSSTVKYSDEGIAHISCTRLKQRFSFAIPQVGDLYANLDLAKVSDTLVFVWKLGEELEKTFETIVSSLFSQGFQSVLHAVVGDDDLPSKTYAHDDLDLALKNSLVISEQRSKTNHKKIRLLKELQTDISSRFAGPFRLYFLEKIQEVNLLLRQIGSQKRKSVFFKDERAHIVGEKISFEGDGSIGTLQVQGYIRSQPFSVNSLAYIPGWGEFQLSKMEILSDPFPLSLNKRNRTPESISEVKVLDIPDPRLQETLDSTCENELVDDDEMSQVSYEGPERVHSVHDASVRKVRAPRGYSSYQSAWLENIDANASSETESENENEISDDFDMNEEFFSPMQSNIRSINDKEDEDDDDDEDFYSAREDEEDDRSTLTTVDDDYDKQFDQDEEAEFLKKIKAAREDLEFPDEMDTPRDIPAKVRFQKYHGLESFHNSSWVDTYMPSEYSKIFGTRSFMHLKRRILKREKEGALQGWYVTIHVKDVPKHMYIDHIQTKSPVVVFSLLPFEQKMTVVHAVVKSHSSGHIHPIKSKERLVFHIGFRRFTNCPIFSVHSTGDKHKFCRFFQPGQTVVATMYAPLTFPPSPVSVYRMLSNGDQELVATGSLGYPNPNRIILKKIVLAGHPFKIDNKHSVIRYMFFNREDVLFYKSIKLHTKLGGKGSIKEPLGTHGHMKCEFKGQLKSHDTVLMNLYKRVFPKWSYVSFVSRPLSIAEKRKKVSCENRNLGNSSSDIHTQKQNSKKKKVSFFDE